VRREVDKPTTCWERSADPVLEAPALDRVDAAPDLACRLARRDELGLGGRTTRIIPKGSPDRRPEPIHHRERF
jgi:hypothetical protein